MTVARVESGTVAPQAEFIATVFYQEISDTAAEISGLVEAVRFEEGQGYTVTIRTRVGQNR